MKGSLGLFDIIPKRLCVCEESERMVLGAAAISPVARAEVVATLCEADFHTRGHQGLYRLLRRGEDEHAPVESLIAWLAESGIDRPRDVYSRCLAAAVLDQSVPWFCRRLKELTYRRQAALAAIEAASTEGLSAEEVRERIERSLVLDGATVPVLSASEAAGAHMAELRERARGAGPRGVMTPWAAFNNLTGGLRAAEHWVIGARTSIGKTAFALALAHYAAASGVRVLYASLEMKRAQLFDRLYASLAGIPALSLRTGHLGRDDLDALEAVRTEIAALPLDLVDASKVTVRDLAILARRLPPGGGLLIIDYVQLLMPVRRLRDRRLEVSEASRGLKVLAGEIGCPVVVLSALSRPAERTGKKLQEVRPTRFDLKESGDLESDADGVVLLHRADYAAGERTTTVSDLEVIVDKQRNGPPGSFFLRFDRQYQRIV